MSHFGLIGEMILSISLEKKCLCYVTANMLIKDAKSSAIDRFLPENLECVNFIVQPYDKQM